jgi:putative molybdopterin biosynthesis protein
VLTSLVRADGLLCVPATREGHHAGAEVEVELLRPEADVERTIVSSGRTTRRSTSRPRCCASATPA